jgi:hypothetical protein
MVNRHNAGKIFGEQCITIELTFTTYSDKQEKNEKKKDPEITHVVGFYLPTKLALFGKTFTCDFS